MFKTVVFGLSVVAGMLFGGSVVNADQYIVESGDTVSSIAMDNGVTVDDIVSLNGIEDADVIFAGEVFEVEGAQTAVINTAAKRNETVQVSDPDSAVVPAQTETITPVQEVQPAQVDTITDTQDNQVDPTQQDTPVIAPSDIVTADGVDDKGIKFDDNNDSNDQYYVNSVNDWGYGHTEDNSDKNVTAPVLTVPAPDQFITPQHTTFNSSEAQPIAGDSSLDGSKVFNGSDWVLK